MMSIAISLKTVFVCLAVAIYIFTSANGEVIKNHEEETYHSQKLEDKPSRSSEDLAKELHSGLFKDVLDHKNEDTVCEDILSAKNCLNLKKSNICVHRQFGAAIRLVCRKSCGVCVKADPSGSEDLAKELHSGLFKDVLDHKDEDTVCKDESSANQCLHLKNDNMCIHSQWGAAIRRVCKKSCGVCVKADPSVCEDQSSAKDCLRLKNSNMCIHSKFGPMTRRLCRKSCGVCVKADHHSVCKDKSSQRECLNLKKSNLCVHCQWGAYIRRNCRKTCGVCV